MRRASEQSDWLGSSGANASSYSKMMLRLDRMRSGLSAELRSSR
jgi:hypothetical protein